MNILDQELIGIELGLRIPKKGKKIFKRVGIKFLDKDPVGGFGTQIEKEKYSIQKFFDKYSIPLIISKLLFFETEHELRNFLKDNLKSGNDVILRYNNVIFKSGEKGHGHFSVISEYDDKTAEVVIGDPNPPFFKKASLKQILYSISNKLDGQRRGFYIICRN